MEKYQDKNPTILVIGDLMIDHYFWGEATRISPEAPVPIINIQKESRVLGGAGNVINNLIALGANVKVISVIGDDQTGFELKKMLEKIGVDSGGLIFEAGRKSTKKSRIVASNQQVIRFDNETVEKINQVSEEKLIDYFKKYIENIDTILISDYAKGVLTDKVLSETIKLAKSKDLKILIDPKGRDFSKYRGATLITPNKKEAMEATKIEIKDDDSLKKAGFWLKDKLDLDVVIITLSEDGIAIFDENFTKIPTVAKEIYDVTGAGDTVLSTLGFVLACGGDIKEACKIANSVAAVVVGKIGSATASWDEVIRYEQSINSSITNQKIATRDEIEKSVKKLKSNNKKIVFTNGCFDILHLGHIKYLEKAKSFGDILIVGLNSDNSVKRLKGDSRPINSEDDRAYLLASLWCVDYVTIFEEDTPLNLIKIIKPDILVKGGDYKGKKVVGSDLVDEVKLVDFVRGKSTTSIIEKIKDS